MIKIIIRHRKDKHPLAFYRKSTKVVLIRGEDGIYSYPFGSGVRSLTAELCYKDPDLLPIFTEVSLDYYKMKDIAWKL
jgi:hypothetical protein